MDKYVNHVPVRNQHNKKTYYALKKLSKQKKKFIRIHLLKFSGSGSRRKYEMKDTEVYFFVL